jgi:uncharacterized membrane protein
MKSIASIFISLILIGVGEIPCESDWVLVKDKSDIKIYSCKFKESDIKQIKANTNVDASITDLATLLMDVNAFPEWMPNIKSTEVLNRVSENEIYYYTEIKIPWPFSNRDNIMHIKLHKDTITKIESISIEGIPDYIPERPGMVRIQKSNGMWEFTPNENGSTDILLKYLADPGGSVPAWIVNFFVADVPYKTLIRLKETIKKKNCEKPEGLSTK